MESNKSADAINAAVMRIGRISRTVFEDKRAMPQEHRHMFESGDAKEDPGPDHKSFAPNETNSVTQKIPGHEMAKKKADEKQPGVDDYDDEAETVAKPEEGAKKEHRERKIMNKVVSETGLRNMGEWRMLAGLTPMYEGQTGEVPTEGAKKQNKMKAGGLPGLEGTAVQDINPEENFDDGADAEEVFDAAPGDLKKESYNRHFGHFLEARGLTPDLFAQLVDEAIGSNDVAEMDALLAVEGIFGDWMKKRAGGGDVEKNKAMLAKTSGALQAKKQGKIDPVYGRPKMSMRKIKAGVSQDSEDQEEEFAFEADSDEKGNPDWKRALASMKRGR